MKQIVSLALALVLMGGVLTGCGCSANVSDHPGGMITEETHVRPHPTATHETTRPTEPRESTLPTVTGSDPTGESSMPNGGIDGNGGNGGSGNSGGGNGSTGGGTGSNGTPGGTGNGESSMPTDAANNQRGRSRMPGR